ncbi:MAG: hypothetical protein COS89_00045 [Deltaproteobacteria bacterium CG07_land_8_20_14_0_80_38_7]|nr:MAG: hypothetical protein COS89_00045 [Deltaproteobacteria bacterium CG07_land_8_20_14_0_80_38_7]
MKKTKLLIALIVLFSMPCVVNAKKNPDWVDGNSKKYSEPRYFIGVGAVSMEKGGKKQQVTWVSDLARAEIAKTLRSRVQATTSGERTVTSENSAKPESNSSQKDIVVASTDEILNGIEIKEFYRDKKTKMLYALAVLDRPRSARIVQKQIDDLKQVIVTEMDAGNSFQNDGDILLAIRHYNKALKLADIINDKNEVVSILDPATMPKMNVAENEAAKITTILYGLKKRVRFVVKVQGPADSVKTYIIKGLSNAGFVTKESIGGTDKAKTYVLSGNTDLNYKGDMNMGKLTVQIYQADLDLEIMDEETNETIGALTWSASGNEKMGNMASKSAVRALGSLVERTLPNRMMELF